MRIYMLLVVVLILFTSCANLAMVGLPSFSRGIEAYRDAEAFEKPIESRSDIWHVLKYPQFAAWGLWGYYTLTECKKDKTKIVYSIAGLGLAWLTFEGSLNHFRNSY